VCCVLELLKLAGRDALYAAMHAGGCGGCALSAGGCGWCVLSLEVLKVMRRRLPCMPLRHAEGPGGRALCAGAAEMMNRVLEMLEVTRYLP